ncbi:MULTISPECIES: UvrD-helicase domain-containing protein [Pseudomonas]|uniref:UvrD-helicase domain-containing protein n=1 Tax=Pseudomonas TaxID=286 RepID=UPI001BE89932|nr:MULTISPECIES: UvrD-helicase domain-containing protein [Pseudomonas]MBT2339429.1 ATP-binding protein [Pseudomonas fluorescens]MCD4529309.1 ATP-binding protein [Pseudomonas sp. C3-2018]
MTLFIPEWQRSTGAYVHVKRALRKLDDNHVVRQCLAREGWTPDFFLQHAQYQWLTVVLCEVSFETLDPDQLFSATGQQAFIELLSRLEATEPEGMPSGQRLGKLILMWNCTPEQTKRLWQHYSRPDGPRLMSKSTFIEHGHEQLPRLLSPLSHEAIDTVMGHYFPEAEIPAICTTRRHFSRDNSPKTTRYFLDSQQEWASKLDLELPEEQTQTLNDFSVRLVNGVAGSGKTLIAANRALILASKYPDLKILMLIHNVPVVKDLKHRLKKASSTGVPRNLTLMTALAWIRQQWVNHFEQQPEMASAKKVTDQIAHYRKSFPDLKPGDEQLLDEFDFINESLICNEQGYLSAERAGQGFALRKEERTQVWALYEQVTAALSTLGLRLWSSLSRDLCLTKLEKLDKYQHILVDEAQFFAPTWFQLVKSTLADVEGSLFLCADPNQGFLKSRLSWKRVGLDVAGKTKKLHRSYRTTQAILRAAGLVLAEFTQTDPDDYLQPDFDGMEEGIAPLLIRSDTPQDAVIQLCNEIADYLQGSQVNLSNMLVLYGRDANKKLLFKALSDRFGSRKIWDLNSMESIHVNADNLRVSTVDTATGLEASIVFLLGLEKLMKETAQAGILSAQESEQNSRKLYMAMTRAGQRLILISTTLLPEGIANLFLNAQKP